MLEYVGDGLLGSLGIWSVYWFYKVFTKCRKASVLGIRLYKSSVGKFSARAGAPIMDDEEKSGKGQGG
ncbi:MAG: hypothetical protein ACPL4E_09515, partial [Thermoproteota archaeon]